MAHRICLATILLALLVGCAGTENRAGAPTGASTVASAGTSSALIPGLAENTVGARLDAEDRRALAEAERRALNDAGPNRPVPWTNPRSGHFGQVLAGPSYFVNDRNCRDYAHTITVDGEAETLRGTACRDADGGWRNAG
ncbi:MAG: RT0821/Lpp0805 family surface protein [Pseudomonadota bacterium]